MACSFDSEMKIKGVDMLVKLEKYWDGMNNINMMLIVATVFDPRKKMQYAKLCFDELYGKDSLDSKALCGSVNDLLRQLFTEYSARYNEDLSARQSQSQPQSQPNSESLSQSTQDNSVEDSVFGYTNIDFQYNELLHDIGVQDTRDELDTYLKEGVEHPKLVAGTEYNVLSYWKLNSGKFPNLAEIARDVLAMQVSSVASESAFSTSGRIINPYRSCLTHYMIEVLMCTEQ